MTIMPLLVLLMHLHNSLQISHPQINLFHRSPLLSSPLHSNLPQHIPLVPSSLFQIGCNFSLR